LPFALSDGPLTGHAAIFQFSLNTGAGVEAAVIDRILRHLGLPTEIPARRPARAPPRRRGTPDQARWDDTASVFEACF